MTKEDLFNIGEIGIFYQYLALGNTITFNNGLTDLELSMNTKSDLMPIVAKNLSYPGFEPMPYDNMLYVGNISGIIDRLKEQPSKLNKEDNKWNEIKCYVASTVCLNKYNYTRR